MSRGVKELAGLQGDIEMRTSSIRPLKCSSYVPDSISPMPRPGFEPVSGAKGRLVVVVDALIWPFR